VNRLVLDTDILTLFQAGHPPVLQQAQACSAGQVALTIISVEEELRGWYMRLRRAKKLDQLAIVYQRLTDAIRFISKLEILSFPVAAIARYNQLRKVCTAESARTTFELRPSFSSMVIHWSPGT
jgi:tRNA(fMet)-specific endonuclease VapC